MAFIKFKPLASSFYFHSKISISEIKEEMNFYITDNEKVFSVYRSKRDMLVLTDKRIILIDKKGISGFRRSIYGINYSSVSAHELSVREFDSKLILAVDTGHTVIMNFSKGISLEEVSILYKYIASNSFKN